MPSSVIVNRKIELENFIFSRAALEQVNIRAREGYLFATGGSALLEAYLKVYNRFFARENKRFLKQEISDCIVLYHHFYQSFKAEQYRHPLVYLFYLNTK